MANTYTQLVFAVKHRQALIMPDSNPRIEQYMCGIVSNCECKTYAIYCNPDHTHLFVSMKPKISCSELVQKVKSSTSLFINENRLTETHFEWQVGFGAFSYGRSQIDDVCKYILNQKAHHEKVPYFLPYVNFAAYGRKFIYIRTQISARAYAVVGGCAADFFPCAGNFFE
jgi:REP element-mobilizing transposase RayT